jgi:hypothetical protein
MDEAWADAILDAIEAICTPLHARIVALEKQVAVLAPSQSPPPALADPKALADAVRAALRQS